MKHLICPMRNDLLKLIRRSRNASLDVIIVQVQQIEDISYHRARNQRLSNQVEQLSLQETETLPNRRYNEGRSHKTTSKLSNKHSLSKNMATSSPYLDNQIQRTVDANTCQQLNSYGYYSCREHRHLSRSCTT